MTDNFRWMVVISSAVQTRYCVALCYARRLIGKGVDGVAGGPNYGTCFLSAARRYYQAFGDRKRYTDITYYRSSPWSVRSSRLSLQRPSLHLTIICHVRVYCTQSLACCPSLVIEPSSKGLRFFTNKTDPY